MLIEYTQRARGVKSRRRSVVFNKLFAELYNTIGLYDERVVLDMVLLSSTSSTRRVLF